MTIYNCLYGNRRTRPKPTTGRPYGLYRARRRSPAKRDSGESAEEETDSNLRAAEIAMSFAATAYNIMIASPGDVQVERNIVRKVVHEWNVVNSAKQGIVLLPIGWETHSTPIMGDRPQALLNKQVLADSDLLISPKS